MTPILNIPSLTLSQLNVEHNLQDALSRVEALVREEPVNATQRFALVDVLCVLGQWERALKQLQTAARLAPMMEPYAQMVRGLIRTEHQRAEVFAGRLLPTPVVDRPAWMEDLARAMGHNAKGEHVHADRLREAALSQAPVIGGMCFVQSEEAGSELVQHHFEWLSDTDSRLGPLCELMMNGSYRWVAYADIQSMMLPAATRLLDLVWLPVKLKLRGTQVRDQLLHGYVPVRYSGTESVSADVGMHQRDALLLSRLTRWQNVGDSGVFACGQKTLMSEGVDFPLLDLRELRLGVGT